MFWIYLDLVKENAAVNITFILLIQIVFSIFNSTQYCFG